MSNILYPRKHNPHKVFFTWQITYHCNYKCTYCHAKKHGNKGVVDTAILPVEKWVEIWDRIYDMYGECEINISGGEPTVYPNFLELVKKITKRHRVEIITNLSYDVEQIVKYLNPERVRFSTSFHPEHTSIDAFIEKVKKIKDNNFIEITNFVPWVPFLKDVSAYKEKFDNNDIKIVLQPFVGKYNGIEYPIGYTKEEKKLLGIFQETGNPEIVEFKTTGHIKKADNKQDVLKCGNDLNIKEETQIISDAQAYNDKTPEVKLCRMGENYGFIHPNGDVERCCKDHSVKLGNIIDGTFKLLEDALPCEVSDCYCWRCMVINNENFWTVNWKNGWDQFYCLKARNILTLARKHEIEFEKAFLEMKKFIGLIYDVEANSNEIKQLKHNIVNVKLDEGWQYLNKGLYDDAKELSKLLIEKYRNDMLPDTLMHVYLYTFRIYFGLKQFDKAKKYLILAKEQNPLFAAIYKLFAMVEFELGNYKQTKQMFQAALRLSRVSNNNIERSEIYSEIVVYIGKYTNEVGPLKFKNLQYTLLMLLEKSLSLNSKNQSAIDLRHKFVFDKLKEGWQYLDKGLYDNAKEFSKVLIEKYKKFMTPDVLVQVYIYTFHIYFALGQWTEAKKYLILAKELNLSYVPIYKFLAIVEFELGNYKQTKQMFQTALRLSRASNDSIRRSEIYSEIVVYLEKYIMKVGPLRLKYVKNTLLHLLEKAISLNPNNQSAIDNRDMIIRNKIIKLNDDIVMDKLREGFKYLSKGLYDDAKELSKLLIEKYINDMLPDTLMHVYLYNFRIYFGLGQWDEAKKYLNLAKEQNSSYAAIYKLFAMVEFELGNYKQTKQMFQSALRLSRASNNNIERSEIYSEIAVYIEKYITAVKPLKFRNIKNKLLNPLKKSILLNPNNQSAIKKKNIIMSNKL